MSQKVEKNNVKNYIQKIEQKKQIKQQMESQIIQTSNCDLITKIHGKEQEMNFYNKLYLTKDVSLITYFEQNYEMIVAKNKGELKKKAALQIQISDIEVQQDNDTSLNQKYYFSVNQQINQFKEFIQKSSLNENQEIKINDICNRIKLGIGDINNEANVKFGSERKEVLDLANWIDTMLCNLNKSDFSLNFNGAFDGVQLIFSASISEIVRQISIHNGERGKLLKNIWEEYQNLMKIALKKQNRIRNVLNLEARKYIENVHEAYQTAIKIIEKAKEQIEEKNNKLIEQEKFLQAEKIYLTKKVYKMDLQFQRIAREFQQTLNEYQAVIKQNFDFKNYNEQATLIWKRIDNKDFKTEVTIKEIQEIQEIIEEWNKNDYLKLKNKENKRLLEIESKFQRIRVQDQGEDEDDFEDVSDDDDYADLDQEYDKLHNKEYKPKSFNQIIEKQKIKQQQRIGRNNVRLKDILLENGEIFGLKEKGCQAVVIMLDAEIQTKDVVKMYNIDIQTDPGHDEFTQCNFTGDKGLAKLEDKMVQTFVKMNRKKVQRAIQTEMPRKILLKKRKKQDMQIQIKVHDDANKLDEVFNENGEKIQSTQQSEIQIQNEVQKEDKKHSKYQTILPQQIKAQRKQQEKQIINQKNTNKQQNQKQRLNQSQLQTSKINQINKQMIKVYQEDQNSDDETNQQNKQKVKKLDELNQNSRRLSHHSNTRNEGGQYQVERQDQQHQIAGTLSMIKDRKGNIILFDKFQVQSEYSSYYSYETDNEITCKKVRELQKIIEQNTKELQIKLVKIQQCKDFLMFQHQFIQDFIEGISFDKTKLQLFAHLNPIQNSIFKIKDLVGFMQRFDVVMSQIRQVLKVLKNEKLQNQGLFDNGEMQDKFSNISSFSSSSSSSDQSKTSKSSQNSQKSKMNSIPRVEFGMKASKDNLDRILNAQKKFNDFKIVRFKNNPIRILISLHEKELKQQQFKNIFKGQSRIVNRAAQIKAWQQEQERLRNPQNKQGPTRTYEEQQKQTEKLLQRKKSKIIKTTSVNAALAMESQSKLLQQLQNKVVDLIKKKDSSNDEMDLDVIEEEDKGGEQFRSSKAIEENTADIVIINGILKSIFHIYAEKLKQVKGLEKDNPIQVVAFDYMIRKHGIKQMAEQKLQQLIESSLEFSKNPRILLFLKLYGFMDDKLDHSDFEFFIQLILLFEESSSIYMSKYELLAQYCSTSEVSIPLQKAQCQLKQLFKNRIPDSQINEIQLTLSNTMSFMDNLGVKQVNFETLCETLIQVNKENRNYVKEQLNEVFIACSDEDGAMNCEHMMPSKFNKYGLLESQILFFQNCDLKDIKTSQKSMSFDQFATFSKEYKLFGHKYRDQFFYGEQFVSSIDDLIKLWTKYKKEIMQRLSFYQFNDLQLNQMIQKVDHFVFNKSTVLPENSVFFIFRFLVQESKRICEEAQLNQIMQYFKPLQELNQNICNFLYQKMFKFDEQSVEDQFSNDY